MKIDRLIGILSILLQQDKVTAPYLAEKFEVSRRTINRDIDALCQAGIPLVTTQGQSGGISIMDGFRIDKTLLSSADMQAILTGLQSLDSVSKTKQYQQLMDKLSVEHTTNLTGNNHIMINLSSWYKSSLSPKLELIKQSIEHHNLIKFTYCSPNSESDKLIEPYLLVFQWSSWYVWGYSIASEDFRLYKLHRIITLTSTTEDFIPRPYPELPLLPEPVSPPNIHVKALFDPSVKWRIIDDYGLECITEQKDRRLLFHFDFYNRESTLSWLLSFGNLVELIEPLDLKQELLQTVHKILNQYT